jgi:hypothetical protein
MVGITTGNCQLDISTAIACCCAFLAPKFFDLLKIVSHLNNNLQFIGKQITIDKNNKQAVAPLFIYLPGMDGSGVLFGIQAEALKRFFEL